MERMAEIAMEGIAVQDDEDGERALKVVFLIFSISTKMAHSGKDIMYAAFDASRVENICKHVVNFECGSAQVKSTGFTAA